jgi:hypothetical protein
MAEQTIMEQLRDAVNRCGQNRNVISLETGIPPSTLSRFVKNQLPLRGENVDKLCRHLGLTLTPKPGGMMARAGTSNKPTK